MARHEVDPSISTLAYASGDAIGALHNFAVDNIVDYPGIVIRNVILCDKNKQNADIDIIFFWMNPLSSTWTDQIAVNIADADLPDILTVVHIVAADYVDVGDSSVACKVCEIYVRDELFAAGNDAYLYSGLISRDVMTYTSSDSLIYSLHVERLDR